MALLPRAAVDRPRLPPNDAPLVIAHRGASSSVAEHTLPAYLRAIETGADGLECDVRLTRDGHLVCVHDRTVNRTSNGRGVVSELDLAGLRELDFRSWREELPASADALLDGTSYLGGVAPDRVDEAGSVLTLDVLLGVVADAGRPLTLLIETKHPTRYGGLVEKELVRLLTRYGWTKSTARTRTSDTAGHALPPVRVMSFAPVALRRIRLLAPGLPLVLLTEKWLTARRDGTLPHGVHTVGASIALLRADPSYVARVHDAGNEVFCWTVDEPADVALVRRLGIDAIITNRPAEVADQLRHRRA